MPQLYVILGEPKCNKTLGERNCETNENKYKEIERKLWKYALTELCIHAMFRDYFL